jgi:hypothetical protein
MKALMIVALLLLPMSAQAQDAMHPKPLTGDYYVGPVIDAEEGAPNDHYYVTLTGDSAKTMYESMKSETTKDECVGRMARWSQGLVCYGAGTDGAPADPPYVCYFGINLKTGTLELGADC